MANVVVSQFITLDGVVEDPGGAEGTPNGGWAFKFQRGEEGDRFKLDEVMAAGALLLGRITYAGFATAWPGRTDDVGFADKFNSTPKYVVSSTLRNPDWSNSIVLEGDLSSSVKRLKQDVDGDILVNGSIQLVQALLEHELVDELRLMVFPTVLGDGKQLFGRQSEATSLRLLESRPAADVLILRYAPETKDAS